MNRARRISTGLVGIGLAAAAIMVDQVPASADASGCFVRSGVVHQVATANYNDVPPAGPSVGDSEQVSENIFYPAGTQVGSDQGYIVLVNQDSAGHLWAVSHIVMNVFGGVIDANGYGDLTAELEGGTTTVQAVGLSGPFANMTGTISWVDTSETTALANYNLCPR